MDEKTFNEYLNLWASYVAGQGITYELAYAYAYAALAAYMETGEWTTIVSGFRSLKKQRDLYNRWKQGEPGIFRPARQSWHTEGRAIDVHKGRAFESFRYWITRFPGIRDGKKFGDDGHFDYPDWLKNPMPAW